MRAEDAAIEERLNKLSGLVQDLQEFKESQRKQIEALGKEVSSLREQLAKPTGDYASREDVRKLAEAVQKIDQNRKDDNEKIAKQIENIGKVAAGGGKKLPKPAPIVEEHPRVRGPGGNENGFEYEIQSGDTLSTIAQAYREKGVKVTLDQIYKANDGLNEKSLKVGQKIFIPKPPA